MKIGFLKALMQHTMLPGESLSSFREQFSKLTPEDKAWFRERLTIEYGYDMSDTPQA